MIVISFTARTPRAADLPLIESEIGGAHRYGNKLRELERLRRVAVQVAQRMLSPALDAAVLDERRIDGEIAAVRAGILGRRKEARKGSEATPEEKAALQDLKAARADAWRRASTARGELKGQRRMLAAYRLIERHHRREAKAAYAAAGCGWGTRLQVMAAIDAAAKEPGAGPEFARWTGDGKIAVQLQGGLSPEEALSCEDTRLRIEIVTPDEWLARQGKTRKGPARTPGSRRDRGIQYAVIWLRVGSEGRKPIWVQVPVMIDRPLPSGSKIMWAWLLRRSARTIAGKAWAWEVQLVCRTDAPTEAPGHGTVAVNLGWRQVEGGLRVAYWVDDAGEEGQVLLPDAVLGQIAKAAELRSLRAHLFNDAVAAVRAFLATFTDLPPIFADARHWMDKWRDPERLHRLYQAWVDCLLPGDEEIVALLAGWARQDIHLHDWEANARRNAYLRRCDLYCCFAAQLARRYSVVLMEQHDLRTTSVLPEVEDGTQGAGRALREQQRLAAPHELRDRIKSTCGRVGAMALFGKPAHNTQRCHRCGYLEKWDAAESLRHTCGECGSSWDQDANNCRNQLRHYGERAVTPATEKKEQGSRRFGAARKRAAKSAR